jgi:hypothetical protein
MEEVYGIKGAKLHNAAHNAQLKMLVRVPFARSPALNRNGRVALWSHQLQQYRRVTAQYGNIYGVAQGGAAGGGAQQCSRGGIEEAATAADSRSDVFHRSKSDSRRQVELSTLNSRDLYSLWIE